MTSPTPPAESQFADRTYRSTAALVCGSLLLLLIAWMGGDALIRGEGRVPWLALAALLFVVPLVVAFTLRPAVFVNDERIRVRNPYRTVQLPWSEVADVRASFSSELFGQDGTKYQLWAVPVSLRSRKRAARAAARAAHDDPYGRTSVSADVRDSAQRTASADQTVRDLRDLAEKAGASTPEGAAQVSVRWAYEVIVPAVVGGVLLVVLWAVG
ncbi:PH domain-containing protein [Streptomyces sp. NPDC059452]|uniref:PH domain-containing protein n=1 Tax=Streptomyces sp. NPDC059452 TaxID=3346835 RepID=UPI0036C55760